MSGPRFNLQRNRSLFITVRCSAKPISFACPKHLKNRGKNEKGRRLGKPESSVANYAYDAGANRGGFIGRCYIENQRRISRKSPGACVTSFASRELTSRREGRGAKSGISVLFQRGLNKALQLENTYWTLPPLPGSKRRGLGKASFTNCGENQCSFETAIRVSTVVLAAETGLRSNCKHTTKNLTRVTKICALMLKTD